MNARPGRSGCWIIAVCAMLQAGCRCCCLLDPYATMIDDLKEYPIVSDGYYHPRWDISRAGKPDWCGPVNRRLAPCRCDCVPEWAKFDPIWHYPPRHPYVFPGSSFPGSSQYEDVENPPARQVEPLTNEPLTDETLPPPPLPQE